MKARDDRAHRLAHEQKAYIEAQAAYIEALERELEKERNRFVNRLVRTIKRIITKSLSKSRTMPDQTELPLTADQVLEDIRTEIGQSPSEEPLIIRRMAQVRKMQERVRTPPIRGKFITLREVIHWLNRVILYRQFEVNDALLKLIEDLYHELDHYRAVQNKKYVELQHRLNVVFRAKTADGLELPPEVVEPSGNKEEEGTDAKTLRGLTRIYTAPAEMEMPERVMLYSLIYGLKPRYCLEIGTLRGGSATIICGAMDDTGYGQLVCVDPEPRITEEAWRQIGHRAILCEGNSPEILPEAAKAVAEKFDFALIDGDHNYEGVLKDIEGILPLLADEAYLLFHDCYYFEIKEAIEEALRRHPQELSDCGLVSVQQNPQKGEGAVVAGRQVIWGGLRLLRFARESN